MDSKREMITSAIVEEMKRFNYLYDHQDYDQFEQRKYVLGMCKAAGLLLDIDPAEIHYNARVLISVEEEKAQA